jgi:hypothetical protein
MEHDRFKGEWRPAIDYLIWKPTEHEEDMQSLYCKSLEQIQLITEAEEILFEMDKKSGGRLPISDKHKTKQRRGLSFNLSDGLAYDSS